MTKRDLKSQDFVNKFNPIYGRQHWLEMEIREEKSEKVKWHRENAPLSPLNDYVDLGVANVFRPEGKVQVSLLYVKYSGVSGKARWSLCL